MPEKSVDKILQQFFPKTTKKDWEKIAMQETQKKNPFETLSWRGKDDILFLPYYDQEDLAGLDSSTIFRKDKDATRSWINLPAVAVTDEKTANAISLNHLSLGAEGIFFDVSSLAQADLALLLQRVLSPRSFIAFRLNDNSVILNSLPVFIKAKFDPADINGALYWESIPKDGHWDFYFNECENFKPLGLMISPASPAEEVSQALLRGVKTFETLAEKYNPEKVFNAICFSLSADASVIETTARFRSLRMLWFQVARAYGLNNYNPDNLHLHAHSYAAGDGQYGPRENMLKGTYAAMAAILGGCDSLTVSHEGNQEGSSRWARNVSNVLRHESFFNPGQDPVAGAYAFDSITNSIAEKAWKLFQQNSGNS